MSSVTSGSEAGSAARQPRKTDAILETFALFFVVVFLVEMFLAVTTVFQNGFQ